MTAREAAELIRDGDTAAFAAMSNWPWELDGALAERLLETGGHIAIYGHFIPAGTRSLTPELAGQVTYDSNFYGVERGLEPMGNVHYALQPESDARVAPGPAPPGGGADLLAPG